MNLNTNLLATARPSTLQPANAGTAGASSDSAERSAWKREMERAALAGWFRYAPSAHDGSTGRQSVHDSVNTTPARAIEAPQRTVAHGSRSGHARTDSAQAEHRDSEASSNTTDANQDVRGKDDGHIATSLADGSWQAPALAGDAASAMAMQAPGKPLSVQGAGSPGRPDAAGQLPVSALVRPVSVLPLTPGWRGQPPASAEEPEMPTPASAASTSQTAQPAEPLRMHAEWEGDGVHLWLGADVGIELDMTELTRQMQQWVSEQGGRLLSLVCNGKTVYGALAQDTDAVVRPQPDVANGAPSPIYGELLTATPYSQLQEY